MTIKEAKIVITMLCEYGSPDSKDLCEIIGMIDDLTTSSETSE